MTYELERSDLAQSLARMIPQEDLKQVQKLIDAKITTLIERFAVHIKSDQDENITAIKTAMTALDVVIQNPAARRNVGQEEAENATYQEAMAALDAHVTVTDAAGIILEPDGDNHFLTRQGLNDVLEGMPRIGNKHIHSPHSTLFLYEELYVGF